MPRRLSLVLCAALGLTASPLPAVRAADCQPRVVTKTVWEPRITYREVKVPIVAIQPQVEQKTVTIVRDVPEQRTVTRQVPVLIPEERTQTETYTECRLESEEVTREVVVMQPHVEIRDVAGTTSRPVLAEETRSVIKDRGAWSEKRWIDSCGCVRKCRVWVPKLVQEQVTFTVPKLEAVEATFEQAIVTYTPEKQTVTEQICKPVYETKTREVTSTVCVEKLVEREFTEVVWRQVAEDQVVNCLVPELIHEQRELLAADRTLVPKRVTCQVGGCER